MYQIRSEKRRGEEAGRDWRESIISHERLAERGGVPGTSFSLAARSMQLAITSAKSNLLLHLFNPLPTSSTRYAHRANGSHQTRLAGQARDKTARSQPMNFFFPVHQALIVKSCTIDERLRAKGSVVRGTVCWRWNGRRRLLCCELTPRFAPHAPPAPQDRMRRHAFIIIRFRHLISLFGTLYFFPALSLVQEFLSRSRGQYRHPRQIPPTRPISSPPANLDFSP
jgi:hypothetical protein